jgi:hypothetical protein
VNTRYLLLAACAAIACLAVLPLRAEEPAAKASTQRDKFAACAHESKGLKGEERRDFMSDCLKGHGHDGAIHEARDTMLGDAAEEGRAHCNEEADRRKLHGDERRAFIGACVKG